MVNVKQLKVALSRTHNKQTIVSIGTGDDYEGAKSMVVDLNGELLFSDHWMRGGLYKASDLTAVEVLEAVNDLIEKGMIEDSTKVKVKVEGETPWEPKKAGITRVDGMEVITLE